MVLFASRAVDAGETVLMHDPISLFPSRRFAGIENQCFLYPQRLRLPDRLVRPCCLPIPCSRRPVRPRPVRVLAVSRREKVPLLLPIQIHLCSSETTQSLINYTTQKEKEKKRKAIPSNNRELGNKFTREEPRVESVEIDVFNDGNGDGLVGAFTAEVVHDQLLVGGVESEPRW